MEEEKEYYALTNSPLGETKDVLEKRGISGSDNHDEMIGTILDALEKYLAGLDEQEGDDDASVRMRIDRIKHRLIYAETFDEFKEFVCTEIFESAIQEGIFSITKAAFEPGV